MANEARFLQVTSGIIADMFAVDNSFADAIVYGDSGRTSGNIFVWKNSSGSDNGGTIYKAGDGTTQHGEWHMQFNQSFIDVKWFGAKGDDVTNDTVNFQKALDFIANQLPIGGSKSLDLYISKGCYHIAPPATGNDALLLDLSSQKNVNIHGDGPNLSCIKYIPNGATADHNIFRVLGTPDVVTDISEFSIIQEEVYELVNNMYVPLKHGKGLVLESFSVSAVKNIRTFWMQTGVELIGVLICHFNNVYTHWGVVGLNGKFGSSVPNLLNFTSCAFGANDDCGATFKDTFGMHSINFQSCSFEGNGKNNAITLDKPSAIDCSFVGVNGANGLNVKDCYFEGNIGLADIRLDIQTGGHDNPYYGTHTFVGNTFNRNGDKNEDPYCIPDPLDPNNPIFVSAYSASCHTNHNILVTGNGQDPKRLLSQSKCKLVFIGNGFFVNQPGVISNNYVPSTLRKAIEIEYHTDALGTNYWEFDILEQGNTYAGAQYGDAPIFTPSGLLPDHYDNGRVTPQVSDFTRVKAFGRVYTYFDHEYPPGVLRPYYAAESYNIISVVHLDFGYYEIMFANPLQLPAVPVVTCFVADRYNPGTPPAFAIVEGVFSDRVRIRTFNIVSGENHPTEAMMYIIVF